MAERWLGLGSGREKVDEKEKATKRSRGGTNMDARVRTSGGGEMWLEDVPKEPTTGPCRT